MLLIPLRRTWYYLGVILALFLAVSTTISVIGIQLILKSNEKFRESFLSETEINTLADQPWINSVINFPLEIFISVFIGCFLILVGMLFIWSPNLSTLSIKGEKGEMKWVRNRLSIPERQFIIEYPSSKISIRRKHSSLRGLLSQEFILELQIEKNHPEMSFISDFGGYSNRIETSTHTKLISSVKFEFLPLKMFQIRALLAVLTS